MQDITSPVLGGIDIGQHDDRRCIAVWRHIWLRDPAKLHDIVRQLLIPTPVVLKGIGEHPHLSICPRICALTKDLQRRWLALMHLPGISQDQIKILVLSVAPYTSDPMTSSILESLARLHRVPYTSTCCDSIANPVKTHFSVSHEDSPVTILQDGVRPEMTAGMEVETFEQHERAKCQGEGRPSFTAEIREHTDSLLLFLATPGSSQISVGWLQECPNDIAQIIFELLDLKSRPMCSVDVFTRAFATVSVRYDLLCLFYRTCFVPFLASLSTPASRQLFTLLQDLAACHPRAMLHGLMSPLLQLPLKNPQVELFSRIGKESLSSTDRLAIVQHAIGLSVWTDELIKIVQSLLACGIGHLPKVTAAELISKISMVSMDPNLCKSAKFPGLIITIATKYATEFAQSKAALLDACESLPTFLKKVALKSVQTMTTAS